MSNRRLKYVAIVLVSLATLTLSLINTSKSYSIEHIVVNMVVGCTFLIVGLFVWNAGKSDSITSAFLRVCLFTGIAVILDSHCSSFQSDTLNRTYTLAWLICYILIPPACLDFVLRFTNHSYSSHRWQVFLVYLAPLALIVCLSFLLLFSGSVPTLSTIRQYEFSLRVVFGLMLFIYLVLSLLLLLVSWIRAKRKEERNISRWLLLCTVIGVAPFVIMHKLPTLWSSTPLISIDLAMMFLIVSPIGWGMAVASFKLLPIERTLSRTFIYVTAGTIAVYGVLILISFGMVDVEYNILSLIALSIAAVFVTFLAGFTLVKGIRGVVDRIYFGDWYSFRDELQRISKKLASSIVEREIVVIITEQLPDILKIDKAILVVRETDQAWKPVVQRDLPLASEFEENLRSLNHLVDKEAHDAPIGIPANDTLLVWGIEVILPLVHANQIMGCLLLGRKETHAPYSIRD